jgi:hypothetical protein
MFKQKFLALLFVALSFSTEANLIGTTEYFDQGSAFVPESTTLQEGETVRFNASRGFYDAFSRNPISVKLLQFIDKHGDGWWDLGRYEVVLKRLDLAFWRCPNEPASDCKVGGNFTFSGGMSYQRLEPTSNKNNSDSRDFHRYTFEDQDLFQSMAEYSANGDHMFFDFEAVGDTYNIQSANFPWVEAQYWWELKEYEIYEVTEPNTLSLLMWALVLLLVLKNLARFRRPGQLLLHDPM